MLQAMRHVMSRSGIPAMCQVNSLYSVILQDNERATKYLRHSICDTVSYIRHSSMEKSEKKSPKTIANTASHTLLFI